MLHGAWYEHEPGQHRPGPALLLFLLLLLLLLVGCAPARQEGGTPPERTTVAVLRVTGAASMEPLLRELARAYMREHPEILIEVSGGGSRWGIQAVREGQAEIGMVSRPLSEAESLGETGSRALVETPIARDGIALIVNPANPINRIEREELERIFTGEHFQWDGLGWLAGDIELVSRENGSGDRAIIESFLLGGRPLSSNALLMPSPAAVIDHVAEQPNALGYASFAQLSGVVKALRVDDLPPTLATLQQGDWPFTRELSLVTSGPPQGESLRFMDWILSEAARPIIERRYRSLE